MVSIVKWERTFLAPKQVATNSLPSCASSDARVWRVWPIEDSRRRNGWCPHRKFQSADFDSSWYSYIACWKLRQWNNLGESQIKNTFPEGHFGGCPYQTFFFGGGITSLDNLKSVFSPTKGFTKNPWNLFLFPSPVRPGPLSTTRYLDEGVVKYMSSALAQLLRVSVRKHGAGLVRFLCEVKNYLPWN